MIMSIHVSVLICTQCRLWEVQMGKSQNVFHFISFARVCFSDSQVLHFINQHPVSSRAQSVPPPSRAIWNFHNLGPFQVSLHFRMFYFYFLFFPFLPAPWHMEFPGQGSFSSSLQLWPLRSCSNTRFNPLCQAGDQTCVPALQRCHQSHCATMGTPHLMMFCVCCFQEKHSLWLWRCLILLSMI